MNAKTPELKKVASELIGPTASQTLMNRIFLALDETPNPQDAVVKVEKLVALFLGRTQAGALREGFLKVLA